MHLKPSRKTNSEVWKWELSFLYVTHRQHPFYITMNYYDNIPKDFQIMERTWNCTWHNQREITQKEWKWELSFLYVIHPHDLYYITVKHHDDIPNGIEVMEQTQNCILNHQREITQKRWKLDLSFLYMTHHHDMFYITVKYHNHTCIPNGI